MSAASQLTAQSTREMDTLSLPSMDTRPLTPSPHSRVGKAFSFTPTLKVSGNSLPPSPSQRGMDTLQVPSATPRHLGNIYPPPSPNSKKQRDRNNRISVSISISGNPMSYEEKNTLLLISLNRRICLIRSVCLLIEPASIVAMVFSGINSYKSFTERDYTGGIILVICAVAGVIGLFMARRVFGGLEKEIASKMLIDCGFTHARLWIDNIILSNK